jgi:hypothetical protein
MDEAPLRVRVKPKPVRMKLLRVLRKSHDVVDRQPGDLRGPLRSARQDVPFGLGVEIGEPGEIRAIDHAFGQQHVHDGERQGRVTAGPHDQRQVRLLDRRRTIDVDDDQLRAACLTRAGHVRHNVDLGRDRVRAPHDDEIGILHLAWIGPDQLADAG